MADLNVSLVIKLVDQITAPIRNVTRGMGNLHREAVGAADGFKQAERDTEAFARTLNNIGNITFITNELGQLGDAMSRVADQARDAASAAEFSWAGLQTIAEVTDDQLKVLKGTVNDMTQDTFQSSAELTTGLQTLMAGGIDITKSVDSLTTIGRTATAADAEITDLSNAALALISNLDIQPEGLAKSFDIMALGGKRGRFELKDMAAEFPKLTGRMQLLGMTGQESIADLTAALQIARETTGSGGEAANNMFNFLNKLTAKETAANFAKFGVDLEAEMQEAADLGISPLVHMLDVIEEQTGGNAFRIGELFADTQVGAFLAPMLSQMKEFKALRADLLAATGVVDGDLKIMSETAKELREQAQEGVTNLSRAIGDALEPSTKAMDRFVASLSNGLAKVIDNVPVIGQVFAVSFGVMGTVLSAAGTLGSGLAGIAGTALLAHQALGGRLGPALAYTRRMAGGAFLGVTGFGKGLIALVARPIPMAQAGIRALNVALLSLAANPVGLLIAAIGLAIAGAAFLIYKYWKPISAFFAGVFKGIGEALGPLMSAFAPLTPVFKAIGGAIGWVVGWFGRLLSPVNASADSLEGARSAGERFGQFIGMLFKWSPLGIVLQVWSAVGKALSSPIKNAGAAIANVWDFVRMIFSWSPIGMLARLWGPVAGLIASPAEAGQQIIDGVWSFLKGLFRWSPVGLIAGNWRAITGALTAPLRAASKGVSAIWDGIKSVFNWSPAPLVAASWSGLKEAAGKALDGLKSLTENAMTKIGEKISGAFGWLKKLGKELGVGVAAASLTLGPASASPPPRPPYDFGGPPPAGGAGAAAYNEANLIGAGTIRLIGEGSGGKPPVQQTVTHTTGPITVHAAPGQDAGEIADEVIRKLERKAGRDQRGALYDVP